MVSAVDIRLRFGHRVLLDNLSVWIGPRDRIGLVGSNGTGKSTLLKILAGEIVPDGGKVTRAKHLSVGLLPQEGITLGGRTLYDEAESVFADALETERRMVELEGQLSREPESPEEHAYALELYGELQQNLESSDVYRRTAEIERVLSGLGFTPDDSRRSTDEFSGGWQMRIALAKLLLERPSLLLLDEPTNHLDLDSLQWLEGYIAAYRGAVILVSHDRRFLDTQTGRTFALSQGRLTEYDGNYSFYEKAKEGHLRQLRAAKKNQEQEIRQAERFIERFRYKATKARQVQSRIKALGRMERVEIEEEEDTVRLAFPTCKEPGRSIVQLRSVVKRYGSHTVFRNVDMEIGRGDRVAFVGVNGAGKSTLARIIAGVEPFDSGDRLVGHNVIVSYFAQHQAEELDPAKSVFQTMEEVATGDIRPRLRTLLGSFLFSGDDVHKSVGVLSGGEKSRLALAKMLVRPANFLVMDEPTNHLDMQSKGVLQRALSSFEGSYVVVSHDRDFLDPLVHRVADLGEGGVRMFIGNVSEFTEKNRREGQIDAAPARFPVQHVSDGKMRKRQEAELRQNRYRRAIPLREEISRVELAIEEKEQRKREYELLMGDPDFYRESGRVKEITGEYRMLEDALRQEYVRWNELNTELERLIQEHQFPQADK
ncbi:MAG: ABC-F family ATP-binding cassette domain-containing protein [Bacteroidota bacterium]